MIFYTGDIYGEVEYIKHMCSAIGITNADTLILLGDVGVNYYTSKKDEARKKILNDIGVTILCIHGNHEMSGSTKLKSL